MRFAAQDEEIAQLKQSMLAMQESTAQFQADTQKNFEKVAEREQALKTDLEQAMRGAIAQQSTQLTASLDELKSLMLKREKRSRSKEDNDMSE